MRIDGTTERGDGSHYHITWLMGPERQAKDSNEVIRDHGWRPHCSRLSAAGTLEGLTAVPQLYLDSYGVLADFAGARQQGVQ